VGRVWMALCFFRCVRIRVRVLCGTLKNRDGFLFGAANTVKVDLGCVRFSCPRIF
jgi:hypothetical protein